MIQRPKIDELTPVQQKALDEAMQSLNISELTPAKRQAIVKACRSVQAANTVVTHLSEQMAMTRALTELLQARAAWLEARKS